MSSELRCPGKITAPRSSLHDHVPSAASVGPGAPDAPVPGREPKSPPSLTFVDYQEVLSSGRASRTDSSPLILRILTERPGDTVSPFLRTELLSHTVGFVLGRLYSRDREFALLRFLQATPCYRRSAD